MFSVLLVICYLYAAPAISADWGYEETSKDNASILPDSHIISKFQQNHDAKSISIDRTGTVYGAKEFAISRNLGHTIKKPEAGPFARVESQIGNDEVIINDWIDLYRLASLDKFTEVEVAHYRQELLDELKSKAGKRLHTIKAFWPQVTVRLQRHPEQAQSFGNLFKALLRLHARLDQISDRQLQITQEVLGPERIAVPGDPPLTEEAIDAYNDMACFLYAQKHTDKTIDASDNRMIMAQMICDKYKDAPSPQAKMSMVNFALTWAKFKIIWANANNKERELLLSQFDSKDSSKQVSVADPVVDSVFRAGPWRGLIYKSAQSN